MPILKFMFQGMDISESHYVRLVGYISGTGFEYSFLLPSLFYQKELLFSCKSKIVTGHKSNDNVISFHASQV